MTKGNSGGSLERLVRPRWMLNCLVALSGLLLLSAVIIWDGKWHILLVVCAGLLWLPALYLSEKLQEEANKNKP